MQHAVNARVSSAAARFSCGVSLGSVVSQSTGESREYVCGSAHENQSKSIKSPEIISISRLERSLVSRSSYR